MISVIVKARVGPDGTLAVQVPTSLREMDVEGILTVQPLVAAGATPEERGWPAGFFERTFGSLRGDPLERLPQGEYEQREAIE